MKTVTIDGNDYEIPDHAKYIAMDADGMWAWYEHEPVVDTGLWIRSDEGGRWGDIGGRDRWLKTLRSV